MAAVEEVEVGVDILEVARVRLRLPDNFTVDVDPEVRLLLAGGWQRMFELAGLREGKISGLVLPELSQHRSHQVETARPEVVRGQGRQGGEEEGLEGEEVRVGSELVGQEPPAHYQPFLGLQ